MIAPRVEHGDTLQDLVEVLRRIASSLEREEARRGTRGLARMRRRYPADEIDGRERPDLKVVP